MSVSSLTRSLSSNACFWILVITPCAPADEIRPASVFAKDNLVAWCIVPFDAAKRGPDQRAEMVKQLGITKVAYDWRAQHVPTFEAEILAYQRCGLEFFAFWDEHPLAFELFEKYKITPQIWKMLPQPKGDSDAARVESAAMRLLPLVKRTRELGSKLGLYNHGGWTGEPQNLVAICQWLHQRGGADHVGIVYNFHHGHDQIESFEQSIRLMKPYLLCLNLNGMNSLAQPKILPIGSGQHETQMMALVRDSGYVGPIGILDHRNELDAAESLSANLAGMREVLQQLKDVDALKTYAD